MNTALHRGWGRAARGGWVGWLVAVGAAVLATLPAVGQTRLRLVPGTLVDTQEAVVAVRIEAVGTEHALAFSVGFDAERMLFQRATAIGLATNLVVNDADAGAGRVGLVLALGPGAVLPAGTQPLLELLFQARGGAAETSLRFLDLPVGRETVDVTGGGLPSLYVDATARVEALVAPVLVTQPADQRVRVGGEGRFSAVVTSAAPVTYQWQKDGLDLPGRTGPELVVAGVGQAEVGGYSVIVRNAGGVVASRVARLDLDPRSPPAFLEEPESLDVREGESVILTGEAVGLPAPLFQWFFEGAPIAGADGSTLDLGPVDPGSTGGYRVVARNELGAVTSRVAQVRLTADPRILRLERVSAGQGVSVAVPLILEALGGESSLSFTVEFDPTWLRFERAESRQPGALVLANAAATGLGRVGVAFALPPGEGFGPGPHRVIDLVFRTLDLPGDVGLVLSGSDLPLAMVDRQGLARPFTPVAGVVTILGVPLILSQPQPARGPPGSRLELRVEAIGPAPLGFQWLRDGLEVPGATSPELVLDPLTPERVGRYAVRITGPAGSTLSHEAEVGIGRLLRVRNSRGRTGELVGVPVQLLATGGEQGAALSFQFETAILEWVEVRPGRDLGPEAGLVLNANELASGRVGFAVARRAGDAFAAGLNELAVVVFRCRTETDGTPVALIDAPVRVEVVDADGVSLTGIPLGPGTVSIRTGTGLGGSPARVLVSPESRTVVVGAPVRFEAVVAGDAPLVYRWFRDGREIPDALGPVLELPSAGLAHAGEYALRVENPYGTGGSLPVTLTVLEPPRVVVEPGDVRGAVGTEVRFEVAAAGTAPLQYQWFRDGVPLVGARLAALVLPLIRPTDAGGYSVEVSNAAGRVVSRVASLAVLEPPRFERRPAPAAAAPGARVEFLVEVSGSGPFQYQWRLNGQDLPRSTHPTAESPRLVIDPVTRADGGSYSVVVTGEAGSILSDPVTLSIAGIRAVAAADDFGQATPLEGESGVGAVSTRNATRQPPLEPSHAGKPGGASVWFRWTAPRSGTMRLNTLGSGFDTLLAVYTGTALGSLVTVASDDDQGGFFTSDLRFNAVAGTTYFFALDGLGGVQGEAVFEWALAPGAFPVPRILSPPPPLTALAGATVRLQVVAEGATGFQWRRNGTPIPGATTPAFTVPAFSADRVGTYDVVVSGPGGSVTSAPAPVELGTDTSVRSTDKLRELLGRLGAGGGVPGGPSLHALGAVLGAGGAPLWNVTAGAPLRHTADNSTATTEAGEPSPCGPGGHSLWFLLDLDRAGVLALSATSKPGFPVALALYTGAGVFTDAPLACATNGFLRLEGVKPGLHVLAVDGVGEGDRGIVDLEVRLGEMPAPEDPALPAPAWRDLAPGTLARLQAPAPPEGPSPTYQWFRNGVPIPGAVQAAFEVVAGLDGQGEYSVRIDNGLGAATYRVGRLGLDLEPTLGGPTGGARFEAGRFVVGLAGPPGQRMALLRTGDFRAWDRRGEFWMSLEGRSEQVDAAVGDRAFGFYRAEEIPLQVVLETGLVVDAEDARAWRVEGGRLGREYQLLIRPPGAADWRPGTAGVVGESPQHFVFPPGTAVRLLSP